MVRSMPSCSWSPTQIRGTRETEVEQKTLRLREDRAPRRACDHPLREARRQALQARSLPLGRHRRNDDGASWLIPLFYTSGLILRDCAAVGVRGTTRHAADAGSGINLCGVTEFLT